MPGEMVEVATCLSQFYSLQRMRILSIVDVNRSKTRRWGFLGFNSLPWNSVVLCSVVERRLGVNRLGWSRLRRFGVAIVSINTEMQKRHCSDCLARARVETPPPKTWNGRCGQLAPEVLPVSTGTRVNKHRLVSQFKRPSVTCWR